MKRLFGHTASPTCKRLIIYCVSFIGVCLLSIAIDVACGQEEDPYDYHLNFFHRNLQGGNGFKSFYYTNYPLLYDDSEPEDERTVNSKEWAAYIGGRVTYRAVLASMYGSGAAEAALKETLQKNGKRPPVNLKTNTFLAALALPKNKAALRYYHFAKAIEAVADFDHSKWDSDKRDFDALQKAAKNALANGFAEPDRFLKLRYFYHAQRLLHYSGSYDEAAGVYDKHIANYKSGSHVKYWALSLKAGEERWLGDTVSAAYHFSQIFARCPERRTQAYKNYRYINPVAKDIIRLAANNRERAYIMAIEGLSTPTITLKPLQNVYRNYPSSPMVGLLLIREVNKLEDVYLTPKLSDKLPVKPYRIFSDLADNNSRGQYLRHIENLKTFSKKLAADGKYPEPGLGYLTIAYLCWMQNKAQEGTAALNELKNIKLSPKLDDQQHLLRLMLAAQSIKNINKVNQDSLLTELKWLDNKIIIERKTAKAPCDVWSDEYIPPFAASARDFYQFVLAPAYLKQKDTIMAALAILKSEAPLSHDTNYRISPWQTQMLDFWSYYLSSAKLKTIKRMKQHRPENAYLKLLTDNLSTISYNDLNELLGTMYLREHQYQMAVTVLQKVRHYKKSKANDEPYAIDDSNLAQPFVEQLNDYPKTYHQNGLKDYNKLDFAKAMLRLAQKIKTDPKNAAANYYRMALGFYNTSFSGNASYLISYSWSCYDPVKQQQYPYDGDYLRSATAEKYFLKAREISRDAEFKAKCTFMAAKCRQKQVPVPGDTWIDYTTDYERAVRMNPYFKTLRRSYASTRFYRLAVTECSYFSDYLASSKPVKEVIKKTKVVAGK